MVNVIAGTYGCTTTEMAGGTLFSGPGIALGDGESITGFGTVYGPVDLTDATISGSGGDLDIYGDVSGTGTVSNATIRGDLSVGHSPGQMTLEDVLLGGRTMLTMELGGMSPGIDCDLLIINGLLTLDGVLNVELLGGFTPEDGQVFDLFDGVLIGEFDDVILPQLADGLSWDQSELYTFGQIAVTPEPATIGLLAFGGLTLRNRRRA